MLPVCPAALHDGRIKHDLWAVLRLPGLYAQARRPRRAVHGPPAVQQFFPAGSLVFGRAPGQAIIKDEPVDSEAGGAAGQVLRRLPEIPSATQKNSAEASPNRYDCATGEHFEM